MTNKLGTTARDLVAVAEGRQDLSDWTDEELIAGRRKPFRGQAPRVVPVEFIDELRKRLMSRAEGSMLALVDDAILTLGQLVRGETKASMPRLRACEVVLERALGKTPERIELSQDKPWALDVRALVLGVEVEKEHPSTAQGPTEGVIEAFVNPEGRHTGHLAIVDPEASGSVTADQGVVESGDDEPWED